MYLDNVAHGPEEIRFTFCHRDKGLISECYSLGKGSNDQLSADDQVENLLSILVGNHTKNLEEREQELLPVREINDEFDTEEFNQGFVRLEALLSCQVEEDQTVQAQRNRDIVDE